MKVYACPDECPAPELDLRDNTKYEAAQISHRAALSRWLTSAGFTGPHTGEVVRYQVADGFALYMLGDAPGRKASVLVHLPYWDGYDYRGIEHFPKSAVLDEIARQKKVAAFFEKKSTG